MTLAPETVLQNRYRIDDLLGQGGMGSVYRAWHLALNVPVAIKEMLPQPDLDPAMLAQLRQQFAREANVLARLSHSSLVSVIDFFEEGGNAYLVMNFVEGDSLADRITEVGALSEAFVLDLADQLLDALAYCHTQGVIHRDVKPQNIILRSDGRAVLVDFGLVKLWDPKDPHTKTAVRGMGSPEYAPPEQYSAQLGHTDPRSDVYSLGATLYHALTGQVPLTATDRMADPEHFKPVCALNPEVSEQTERAVLRAMELPRGRRFQSVDAMRAALHGETVDAADADIAAVGAVTQRLPETLPDAEPGASTQVLPETLDAEVEPEISEAGAKRGGIKVHLQKLGKSEKRRGFKRLLILIGVLVLLSCVSLCVLAVLDNANSSQPGVQLGDETALFCRDEVVTVTVWSEYAPTAAVLEAVENYNATKPSCLHVDYVDMSQFAGGEFGELLRASLDVGEGPDIIAMRGRDVGARSIDEVIVPLDQWVSWQELEEDFVPAAAGSVTWNGNIWGLPESMSGIGLIYNRDLIPEEALPSPDDFYDLKAKAADYREKNPDRYYLCNSGLGGQDVYFLAPIYFEFGLDGFVNDRGEVSLDSDLALDAATWIQDYRELAPSDIDYERCREMFLGREVAIWWTGPWELGGIEEAGIPYGVGQMGRPFVETRVWSMTPNALERGIEDFAVAVIRQWAGPDAQRMRAQKNGDIPVSMAVLESLPDQEMSVLFDFGIGLADGVPLHGYYLDPIWEPLTKANERIWEGTVSPAAALSSAQMEAEQRIAEME